MLFSLRYKSVQTYVAKKAAKYLSRELKTRVEIGSLYVIPFKSLVLEDLYVEDLEGDTLIYYSKSSMSSMTVKIENGVFVGEGPFNTHPLEVYFNATDFVNMERDFSSCS